MIGEYIHGLHDEDGAELMAGKPGWIVITEAIGCDPGDLSGRDYSKWTDRGFNVIVRLNNGYAPVGTIPAPGQYAAFAQRCANFVYASPGCDIVVIGNEPNHRQEWPNGEKIQPADYADCYQQCYERIKALGGDTQVLVAGPAPWDNTAGYDWLEYFAVILTLCQQVDGVAIHCYTHGVDPALITSEEMQHGWHWQFRVYRDQCELLSDLELSHLPVYITETDQTVEWADANSGWVKEAYREIDEWNVFDAPPVVVCLCLFRSIQSPDERWTFYNKSGVQSDFQQAVAMGYRAPEVPDGTPTPTPPRPPRPEPAPEPIPDRVIDPRLYARGVTFTYTSVPAGQWYWRMVEAQWLDEEEADRVGPDHHILGEVLKNGGEAAGVPLWVDWPSGSTTVTSKADDLHASYNYDYPMSPSLNEYSIMVADGAPSDKVGRIGMGKDGNSHIHTSTWITWEYVQSGGEQPVPPDHGYTQGYVLATAGLNVREQPTTESAVLGLLGYGSTVVYGEEKNGWLHLAPGWVSADYVGLTDPATTLDVPDAAPSLFAGDLHHPLPGSVITQHFYQNRKDYEQWGLAGHDGTDLGGLPEGTPVLCMADGVVARATFDANYGNYLLIAHDVLGCYTLYCHASELLVGIGDVVEGGQVVMKLGSTGNSTGPHLHVEVRLMNADGSYKQNTPQIGGRIDPETFACLHGLEL